MKKLRSLLIILLLLQSVIVLAQTKISHSAISFKIKNMGFYTSGTIGGLQVNEKFNPAELSSSSLEASVEVSTLNTGNNTRDEHLRKESFFDLAHYPKIFLKSTAFKHKDGNNYFGTFILTMKGKSKTIEIPFTFIEKNNEVTFNAEFKIDRKDFGVGGSSLIMSDEVTVTVAATAVK